LRPVKFAKYLPKYGIEPVILTRRDISYHSYDTELGRELSEIEVIRTESLDPARVLFQIGMKQYAAKRWHGTIKRTINFPDNKTPWVPFAYSMGRTIDFECVYVTAPPFSAFITGYYLAKSTSRPLILDFRDAWLEFPFMPYKGTLQKKFVRYWEGKVVEHAELLTVVDDNIKNSLTSRYPKASHKIHVIPNGYDPDDFAQLEMPTKFTIAYIGTIRRERDPANLMRAVKKFAAAQGIDDSDVVVKFIGHIEKEYLGIVSEFDFTVVTGHLPYKVAIREFCASHVAVLVTTGSDYFFPSRQNEYLASGLPIVVCGKSKGLHLLEKAFESGYPGWIYDYDDIEGMSRQFTKLYRNYKKGKTIRGVTPYKEYTRENLTRRLAGLIHTL
jgi:glycosyltransferase involved in cell wall biosynthesis